MADYRLPGKVRDAIIRYLSQRPWVEVHEGIETLVGLKRIPDEPAPEEEETR